MLTPEQFMHMGAGRLPGHLGIVVTEVASGLLRAELHIADYHLAPNGYLHAGTVVSLADTCAGYGCISNLPPGAENFTTVELKSNHLGTARSGALDCLARLQHGGRTTQIWDAEVRSRSSGKAIALFRCTQMLLYPAVPGIAG